MRMMWAAMLLAPLCFTACGDVDDTVEDSGITGTDTGYEGMRVRRQATGWRGVEGLKKPATRD